ncbi:ribosomal protein L7/L12, partial [Vibrio cholerae HC-59A1]
MLNKLIVDLKEN